MIRKMTPTGFSIKGISAIITAQDPNIDPSDAKSIAEEIRFNLLSSVFGDSKTTSIRSPVRKATSASSAVSKKEEAKQNKLVISELKEIKKSLSKNEKGISNIQKSISKTQSDISKINRSISKISERMMPSAISGDKKSGYSREIKDGAKGVTAGAYNQRLADTEVLFEISSLRKEIAELKKSGDTKNIIAGGVGTLSLDQIQAEQDERYYDQVEFQKSLDKKLDLILDKIDGGGFGGGGITSLLSSLLGPGGLSNVSKYLKPGTLAAGALGTYGSYRVLKGLAGSRGVAPAGEAALARGSQAVFRRGAIRGGEEAMARGLIGKGKFGTLLGTAMLAAGAYNLFQPGSQPSSGGTEGAGPGNLNPEWLQNFMDSMDNTPGRKITKPSAQAAPGAPATPGKENVGGSNWKTYAALGVGAYLLFKKPAAAEAAYRRAAEYGAHEVPQALKKYLPSAKNYARTGAFGETIMSPAERAAQAGERAMAAEMEAQSALRSGVGNRTSRKAQQMGHKQQAEQFRRMETEARVDMFQEMPKYELEALEKEGIRFNPSKGVFEKAGKAIADAEINGILENKGMRGLLTDAQFAKLKKAGIVVEDGVFKDKLSHVNLTAEEAAELVRDEGRLKELSTAAARATRLAVGNGTSTLLSGVKVGAKTAGTFGLFTALEETVQYAFTDKKLNSENLKKSGVHIASNAVGSAIGGAIGAGIGGAIALGVTYLSAGLGAAIAPEIIAGGEFLGQLAGGWAGDKLYDRAYETPSTPTGSSGGSGPSYKGEMVPEKNTTGKGNDVSQNGIIDPNTKEIRFKRPNKATTIAWLANNPGNLIWSDIARRYGAIGWVRAGTGGEYAQIAVFPDLESGEKARRANWSENYGNRPLAQAIHDWAMGPQGGPVNQDYLASILYATGAAPGTRVADLTPDQTERMFSVMKHWEGYVDDQGRRYVSPYIKGYTTQMANQLAPNAGPGDTDYTTGASSSSLTADTSEGGSAQLAKMGKFLQAAFGGEGGASGGSSGQTTTTVPVVVNNINNVSGGDGGVTPAGAPEARNGEPTIQLTNAMTAGFSLTGLEHLKFKG